MPPKNKKSKPGPKPRPLNLNDHIRKLALHSSPPSSEDIQALLVCLLYDTPTDADHHSQRGKLKLDILMGLHKINLDKTQPAPADGGDLDAQLLTMLAERQQRRLQDAARQARAEDDRQDRKGNQRDTGNDPPDA